MPLRFVTSSRDVTPQSLIARARSQMKLHTLSQFYFRFLLHPQPVGKVSVINEFDLPNAILSRINVVVAMFRAQFLDILHFE